MFTLLEDPAEIRKAQSDLTSTIVRQFSTTAIRNIGWQGGRQPKARVHTDGTYWFWSSDYKHETPNPRRLNWFGRIGEGAGVGIAVEINTPYIGRNDSIAGFFARNSTNGRTYLFHSGRVGGGAEGVSRDAFVAWSDLKLQLVYGLIALIIAVYPANIYMAMHPELYADIPAKYLYIRLPFQFLFIWFVWYAVAPERAQHKLKTAS